MIVVPGDIVNKKIEGTYEKDSKIVVKYVGLLEEKKITSLNGLYNPKKDDLVIGKIIDVYPNGWLVDINSPYYGFLLIKDATDRFIDITKDDLNDILTYGEFILAKIINVTRNKLINLSIKDKGLGKLKDGIIISISPKKVARVVGKNASMLNLLKNTLGIEIIVGQNGRIFLKGDYSKILIAYKAIKIIEERSYKKGLTNTIKNFIEKQLKDAKI